MTRPRRKSGIPSVGLIATVGLVGLGLGIFLGSHSWGNSSDGTPVASDPPAATRAGSTSSEATTTAENRRTTTGPTRQALLTPADRATFQTLESTSGGTIGLAISPLGLGQPVSEVGTLRSGVAWSTIKVPIAMAIEAHSSGLPSAQDQALLAEALTASSNPAAEALWANLGPPDAAAATVQSILAAAGDTSTNVETHVLRPGFTSFGQTEWSLAAQAKFMAALPCLPNSRPVRSLMRQVVSDQRWGLGTLGADTEFKGGWGPDPAGRYLVRQMGIAKLSNGHSVAVAIAAMPDEGTFDAGITDLNQIAEWLTSHIEASESGPAGCRA